LQAQGPEFKPISQKTKKKKIKVWPVDLVWIPTQTIKRFFKITLSKNWTLVLDKRFAGVFNLKKGEKWSGWTSSAYSTYIHGNISMKLPL
jgi:hypothetical protein